jgi:hypothetical protein
MASPGTTRRGKVDRKVASVGHRFRVPNNLSAELSTMSIIGSSDLIGRAPGARKLMCQWRREIPQNRRAEIPHFILI